MKYKVVQALDWILSIKKPTIGYIFTIRRLCVGRAYTILLAVRCRYFFVRVSKNSRLSRVRLMRSTIGKIASWPPPIASIIRRSV